MCSNRKSRLSFLSISTRAWTEKMVLDSEYTSKVGFWKIGYPGWVTGFEAKNPTRWKGKTPGFKPGSGTRENYLDLDYWDRLFVQFHCIFISFKVFKKCKKCLCGLVWVYEVWSIQFPYKDLLVTRFIHTLPLLVSVKEIQGWSWKH